MGALAVVKGGAYQYMGYARSQGQYGWNVKVAGSPIIHIDQKMLLGIMDCQELYQYFIINGCHITDLDYASILKTFNNLITFEDYDQAQMLMITINGDIFYWERGHLYQIDEDYMAIGPEGIIAMSSLKTSESSGDPAEKRMQLALETIQKFNPESSCSIGMERI